MIVDNPLYAYWTILDAPEFNVYRIVRYTYGSIVRYDYTHWYCDHYI